MFGVALFWGLRLLHFQGRRNSASSWICARRAAGPAGWQAVALAGRLAWPGRPAGRPARPARRAAGLAGPLEWGFRLACHNVECYVCSGLSYVT